MSRKKVVTENTEQNISIEDRIKKYYEKDTELKSIKKVVDEEKENIKNYFIDNELEELLVDDIKCTVNQHTRDTFNDDMCMNILYDMLHREQISKETYDNIVKVKPYIDEDALENAIYNNIFSAEKIAPCIDSTTVTTLRVSKKKGK